jgi:hypothetical protein
LDNRPLGEERHVPITNSVDARIAADVARERHRGVPRAPPSRSHTKASAKRDAAQRAKASLTARSAKERVCRRQHAAHAANVFKLPLSVLDGKEGHHRTEVV